MILLFVIIWILIGLLAALCHFYSEHYPDIMFMIEELVEPENIGDAIALIIFAPISILIFAPKAIKIFIENLIERKYKK